METVDADRRRCNAVSYCLSDSGPGVMLVRRRRRVATPPLASAAHSRTRLAAARGAERPALGAARVPRLSRGVSVLRRQRRSGGSARAAQRAAPALPALRAAAVSAWLCARCCSCGLLRVQHARCAADGRRRAACLGAQGSCCCGRGGAEPRVKKSFIHDSDMCAAARHGRRGPSLVRRRAAARCAELATQSPCAPPLRAARARPASRLSLTRERLRARSLLAAPAPLRDRPRASHAGTRRHPARCSTTPSRRGRRHLHGAPVASLRCPLHARELWQLCKGSLGLLPGPAFPPAF